MEGHLIGFPCTSILGTLSASISFLFLLSFLSLFHFHLILRLLVLLYKNRVYVLLAAATLNLATGGVPNPPAVTCSRAIGAMAANVPKLKKVV